ncbi:bacteriohemerythrin [Halobacteriaceae bacterium SHR40]|uniref:bacteriohemerythrin n=1 Tax=Halovenus amylolytica TaxID=2500550 RepID=UPI000FE3FBAF
MQPETGEEFIEWDQERYSTQIERFDDQHRRLFELLNDLHVAMERGKSDEKVGGILRELEEYTEYHFGDEEEFMQDCGYAMDCADCFYNHRDMHEEFASKVSELREKHENGEYITMEVLLFARDWLDSHIAGLNQDQNYTEYYADEVPEEYEYEPGKLKVDRDTETTTDRHGDRNSPESQEPDPVEIDSDIYESEELSVPEESMGTWLVSRFEQYSDRPAVRSGDGGFSARRFDDLFGEIQTVAAGLLDLGLKPGDRVGIRMSPRVEWTITDAACYLAGLVSVPVSELFSDERTAHVIEDAAIDVLVTDDAVPERISANVDTVLSANSLPAGDRDQLPGLDAEPDDIATIMYRIGTTEHPRGCALTHRNLRAGVEMLQRSLPLDPGTTGTCFLPLAHVYQRLFTYYLWDSGAAIAYMRSDEVLADLAAIEPEVLVGVPGIYEQLYEQIIDRQDEFGGLRQALSNGVAESVGAARDEGRSLSTQLSLKHRVAERTVFSTLRKRLGLDDVEYALTGTEPIDTDLLEFFRGFGVPVSELYGATELTGLATCNRAGSYRAGTVGAPLPGTEIAVAEDGEVLVRGPNVIERYWNDSTAWRQKLGEDGWYRTGDLGRFTEEGALEIEGPK